MPTNVDNLMQLLELVGNAEGSLLATTWGGPHVEQNLRDGLVRLQRASSFASSSGQYEFALSLTEVAPLFAGAAPDLGHATGELRNARIQVRLALDAATDAAGLPRVPPARVVIAQDEAPRQSAKFGRNKPCPCGSGRKFKRCCGAN